MNGKVLAGGALVTILALGAIGGGAAIASSPDSPGSDDSPRDGFRDRVERTQPEFETETREDSSPAPLAQRARITPAEAGQAALRTQPGQVTKVELEEEEGFPVYKVEVAGTGSAEHELEVDAGNGNILEAETEIEDDRGDRDDSDDRYEDEDDDHDDSDDRYDDDRYDD